MSKSNERFNYVCSSMNNAICLNFPFFIKTKFGKNERDCTFVTD
jgi:hypothetical protein